VLLFSVTQPAGEISALDLRTRRIERRATLAAAAVGEWAGAFAVDLEDRIFVGTPAGRIYELRDGTPAMVFEQAGDAIRGLAAEVNSLFYVTGDGNVSQLRNLRTRSVALTRPSSAWSYVSYHPLPLSDEIKADSCELFVQVVSADTGLLNLFPPVIQGPGLNWGPPSVEGNGGRTGKGLFRHFVQKGVYWVR